MPSPQKTIQAVHHGFGPISTHFFVTNGEVMRAVIRFIQVFPGSRLATQTTDATCPFFRQPNGAVADSSLFVFFHRFFAMLSTGSVGFLMSPLFRLYRVCRIGCVLCGDANQGAPSNYTAHTNALALARLDRMARLSKMA